MLTKRNSLRGSIKHHFTFPYISNRGFFFHDFLLLWGSHFLSAVLHARTSPFPFPPRLCLPLRGGGEEEEEAVLGVIIPGGELTKVGHGYSPAPLFPLETLWIRTLAGNPTGLCSFSIYALYSFSISTHFSFCLSQRCAFIVASRSRCVSCFLPCFSLWGWFSAGC